MSSSNPFNQDSSSGSDKSSINPKPNIDPFTNSSKSIFDSPNEEEKERTAMEQYQYLLNKDTSFIFFFGRQASGKSHFMASLIHYMKTSGVGDLIVLKSNKRDANSLIQQMFQSVHSGSFLSRTARQIGGTEPPTEIDLLFKPKNENLPPMKFTFLEMSGENLEVVQVKNDNLNSGKLPNKIDEYLNCPGLKINFFLVTSFDEAARDAQLIDSFMDYVHQKDPRYDKYGYLLAITKWDIYTGKFKSNVEKFANDIMPQVYQRLKKRGFNNAITNYSLGKFQRIEVKGDTQDVLVQANTQKAELVTEWLYNKITGKSLIPEMSWFEKFRQFIGF